MKKLDLLPKNKNFVSGLVADSNNVEHATVWLANFIKTNVGSPVRPEHTKTQKKISMTDDCNFLSLPTTIYNFLNVLVSN